MANGAPSRSRGGIGQLSKYEHLSKIGEGTYGFVYQANERTSGDKVALKKLLIYKESAGFPLSAIREIKFLNSLKHKNIVNLREIVSSKGCESMEADLPTMDLKRPGCQEEGGGHPHAGVTSTNIHLQRCGNLYLVFDYIEHDLAGLIDERYKFTFAEIQVLMKQLLEALDFLHCRNIMHRDVKPSNLLISQRLMLKLADFGLARSCDAILQNVPVLGSGGIHRCVRHTEGDKPSSAPSSRPEDLDISDDVNMDFSDYQYQFPHDKRATQLKEAGSSMTPSQGPVSNYTNNVITMWYRPPELLFGSTSYGCEVDVWSAGCVFAELVTLRPLFPGKTESEQLDLIFKQIGTPSEASWNGVDDLPNSWKHLALCTAYNTDLRSSYSGTIPTCYLDLLERILVADPKRRVTARLALGNKFFAKTPLISEMSALRIDKDASFHEYQTKKRKFDAMHKNAAKLSSTGLEGVKSSQSGLNEPGPGGVLEELSASQSGAVPPEMDNENFPTVPLASMDEVMSDFAHASANVQSVEMQISVSESKIVPPHAVRALEPTQKELDFTSQMDPSSNSCPKTSEGDHLESIGTDAPAEAKGSVNANALIPSFGTGPVVALNKKLSFNRFPIQINITTTRTSDL